jgi:6-phosphofructokinase 1
MEYTRDLGYCAAQYLIEGGNAAMVSIQGGQFVPIPFAEMIDPTTGRTRVRLVDVHSSRYLIARRYMIRLLRSDFADAEELESLARRRARTGGVPGAVRVRDGVRPAALRLQQ